MIIERPEVWQSRALLQSIGQWPAKDFGAAAPPEPDVVATLKDGRRIGIEVTEIQPGSAEQRRIEEELASVLRAAAERYEESGEPSVLVAVFRGSGFAPTKTSRSTTISGLLDAVKRYLPNEGRVELSLEQEPEPTLPSGVDAMTITRVPHPPTLFHDPRSAWVGPIEPSVMESAVERKNAKVDNYSGNYDELWLLLILGASGPSTWGSVRDGVPQLAVPARFQRIFVLSRTDLRVVEVVPRL